MPGFADRVRIKSSEATERLGLAGLEGIVYGWTTPSSTGVTVIGDLGDDHAVNVHFEERDEEFWFAEDLLEFVDHGAGIVVTLDGVDKEWVRQPSGEWQERPRSS
ncbi:MAG TPA: hypothetical protein VE053_02560 [Allosphingosinicella sp.]|nr:hypothetical protein [Allosphingosinicella sp.]